MRWIAKSVLATALLAPVAAIAASFSSLIFTETDPEAIVMAEEFDGMRGGELRFIEVDPQNMVLLKRKFGIGKELMNGRLKTKIVEIQTEGENPFWTGFSRFSAAKKPAGVFAFDVHKWNSQYGGGSQCLQVATPVFRFKAGAANLIPTSIFPHNGFSVGDPFNELIFNGGGEARYRRSGVANSVADAQLVLDERPGIKAKVEFAELLGYVAWRDNFGRLSGCQHDGQMVWVPEATARTGRFMTR